MSNADEDRKRFVMLGPGLGMAAARKDEREAVVEELEASIREFERKAEGAGDEITKGMMLEIAGGLREKLNAARAMRPPSGRRPEESLMDYATRFKAKGLELFIQTLVERVLQLMLMAGTEGQNAKWTANQILFGLKEAVKGVDEKTLEVALEALVKNGLVRKEHRSSRVSPQYVLTTDGVEEARKVGDPRITNPEPQVAKVDPEDEQQAAFEALREEAPLITMRARIDALAQHLERLEAHLGLHEARLTKVEEISEYGLPGFLFGGFGKAAEEPSEEPSEEPVKEEGDEVQQGVFRILDNWQDFEGYVRRMFRALGVDEVNGTPQSRRRADFLGLAIRLSQELYDAAIRGVGPNRNDALDADFVLSRVANIHDLLIELKAPGAIERSGKSIRKVCIAIMKQIDEEEEEERTEIEKKKRNEENRQARVERVKKAVLTIFRDDTPDREWLEGPMFQAVYDLLKVESITTDESELLSALGQLVEEGLVERIQPDTRFDPKYVLVWERPAGEEPSLEDDEPEEAETEQDES